MIAIFSYTCSDFDAFKGVIEKCLFFSIIVEIVEKYFARPVQTI